MLETLFSNSMDMTGKVEFSKFEKIATQIRWAVGEALLVAVVLEVALAAEEVLAVAVGLAAVEAMEVVLAVEAVATAELLMLVEQALEQGLWLAALAWKPRTLRTLSPTSQHRAARRIQSSTFET